MEELKELFVKGCAATLTFLIAVENKIKSMGEVELKVDESGWDMITNVLGKVEQITIDKVKCRNLLNKKVVFVHISKRNKKAEDMWIKSEVLFGDRLELVYNRIDWNSAKH